MKEMVGGCCVCSDERGWPDNPLVYCDGNGCTVAVHQACYGIVTVPTGPWFCRKCESPEIKGKVRCELCPSKSGALKRSDTGGWAHVVCALYIPEVRFGNVTSMEPIVLRLIPPERYNKACYICQDSGKSSRSSAGACMQCNKSGCKQQFHVTCAQSLGLLCEEAGNYLDNVKYCGYCQHHYSKLKKGGNVKTIPPYKPVTHDSPSSDSSGEKEGDSSPKPSGGSTPNASKNKSSGRKSSHSSTASGKSTPNSKSSGTPSQLTDKSKKQSPSRRGSGAGEGSSGRTRTPAASPQHSASGEHTITRSSSGSGSGVALPAASPGSKGESLGVISSISLARSPVATTHTVTSTITSAATSVVQSMSSVKAAPYQESVITNTDVIETKQTKKRKAISAANNQASNYGPTPPPTVVTEAALQSAINNATQAANEDEAMDCAEKTLKKAKTDDFHPPGQFNAQQPLPPSQSPSSQPSPRHVPSPMPGPSGMNPASNIRSPSQAQGKEREREQVSLLVSVPLPSSSQGLNLTMPVKVPGPPSTDVNANASVLFHQAKKQAAMESSAHAPHPGPGRGQWGGLNVSYESQQTETKPAVSNAPTGNKDAANNMMGVGNHPIRNKKRAAMANAAAAAAAAAANANNNNTAPPQAAAQNMTAPGPRRPPPPARSPVYQETIKDSPPSSPSSDRPLKPKVETKMIALGAAPHMLGNELNPESGAAARLQEQLSAELAAHATATQVHHALLPPPLINKAAQGGGGLCRSGSSSAQSLDQLLERQWEQGSQFLMEQAQHFDIASLLSCLHQLRTENVRLEEHVGSLLQRRDHLLAVNARLAIPLAASGGPSDPGRCTRENGNQMRAPPGPARPDNITADRSSQLIVRDAQQKPS